MSLNFGKNSAYDKYMEFLEDYKVYEVDTNSINNAIKVAVSSWHIIDWLYEENKEKYKEIHNIRSELYVKCKSLKVMHDVANASKHKKINSPKAGIKFTEKHLGPYSSDYSNDYDVTFLKIELIDGTILYFDEEIKKIKLFWDAYFDNYKSV